MSLPNQIVMPADGTTRTYRRPAGASISVVGEDAILRNAGWVSVSGAAIVGSGATSGRPSDAFIGQAYNDATIGALIIYARKKTGWVHHATGASA